MYDIYTYMYVGYSCISHVTPVFFIDQVTADATAAANFSPVTAPGI